MITMSELSNMSQYKQLEFYESWYPYWIVICCTHWWDSGNNIPVQLNWE